MSTNIRRRIQILQRLFYDKTDENHTLTMPEILSELERQGITSDRRAVYEDIEELNNMGWDIIREPTGRRGYFLAYRLFEAPEIRILKDIIRSSSFLSEQKTQRLLGKLRKLEGPAAGQRLPMDILQASAPKAENSSVLYLIDLLSQAISEKKAISFLYYRLNYRKRREFLNDGKCYELFPETLIGHNNRYYLIAATDNWDHLHFRIDRMSEVKILDSVYRGERVYNQKELLNYAQSSFEPEAGKPVLVTLQCSKNCAEELFECFGMNTAVYGVTENHFKADVSTALSMQFFAWILQQNGNVTILQPERARKRYFELLQKNMDAHLH